MYKLKKKTQQRTQFYKLFDYIMYIQMCSFCNKTRGFCGKSVATYQPDYRRAAVITSYFSIQKA